MDLIPEAFNPMNKPRPLTHLELCGGKLPRWSEDYAQWLSQLPSFQNMTERARFGRIKAIRALDLTVESMLKPGGFTPDQRARVMQDIVDSAKLKSGSIFDRNEP